MQRRAPRPGAANQAARPDRAPELPAFAPDPMAVYAHASKITSPILRLFTSRISIRVLHLCESSWRQLFNFLSANCGHVSDQHAVGGVMLRLRPVRPRPGGSYEVTKLRTMC